MHRLKRDMCNRVKHRLASKFMAASFTYPLTMVKTKAQLEQRRRVNSVSSAPEESRAEAEAAAAAEARQGGVVAITRRIYQANGFAAFYAGYGFKMLNTCTPLLYSQLLTPTSCGSRAQALTPCVLSPCHRATTTRPAQASRRA